MSTRYDGYMVNINSNTPDAPNQLKRGLLKGSNRQKDKNTDRHENESKSVISNDDKLTIGAKQLTKEEREIDKQTWGGH